jgi:AraC-like DNA-binding protein
MFLMSASTGVCFLFSFLLFFNPLKQNPAANRWLAVFVLIMGAAFLNIYIEKAGYASQFIFLNKAINAIQFLLAPCLYISICCFISPVKVSVQKVLLHCLPFFVYVLVEIITSLNGVYLFKQKIIALGGVYFLVADLLLVQNLLYMVASIYLLRRHQKTILLVSASPELVNLEWMLNFIFILFIILLTWINDAMLIQPFFMMLTPYIYTFSLFFLAWFALRQKSIFTVSKKDDLTAIAEVLEEKPQPENSKPNRIEDEQLVLLQKRLVQIMEQDKLYLENELNLAQVAEKLGTSIHNTSYLINTVTGTNFHQFVNHYRVEEAKKLLCSDLFKEQNILGVAFQSGFNSKTTFNTTFKKFTGMSPTQYANMHKKQVEKPVPTDKTEQ